MLSIRWSVDDTSRKATFSFTVEREEVIHQNLPAKEAQWETKDYAIYLKATRLGPIDGDVKPLSDSIVKGETTIAGKAKAIIWLDVR